MARLDCETVESAYSSLEEILGFDRDVLDSRLDAFKKCNETALEDEPRNLILDFITDCDQGRISHDSTCWFYATRTHDPNSFRRGIFPINEMLDSTWSFLFSLVQDQITEHNWQKFRRQVEADFYGLGKMTFEAKRKYEQGPYGFLIRDDAFHRGFCGHDYLETPELVEEICRCFRHQFRHDLQSVFHNRTKPCIVKFVSMQPRSIEISCALAYLFHIQTGIPRNLFSDCCYPSTGQAIPSANILDVEWPAVP